MRVIVIITLLFILSCERLDFPATERAIVVEAYLSDEEKFHFVLISETSGYTEDNSTRIIDGADIFIESAGSRIATYEQLDNGAYRSNNPYAGEHGNSYELKIIINNTIQISSEILEMSPSARIDSLWFDLSDPDQDVEELISYYPVISSVDNSESQDFFRYLVYQNESYLNEPEFIFLKNDQFFNGSEFREEFRSVLLSENDKVAIELRKISQSEYLYFSQLRSQITSIGTNQNVIPAPVYGNLTSSDGAKVLGLFSVYSVAHRESTVIP